MQPQENLPFYATLNKEQKLIRQQKNCSQYFFRIIILKKFLSTQI